MRPARNADATRARILDAARLHFSRTGFTQTSVAAIAKTAEVSPNLITRYFGGKDGLFVAATEVRLAIDDVIAGSRHQVGKRLAAKIVSRWFCMEGQDPLLVLLRASGERTEAAEALARFLDRESLEPLRKQLLAFGVPPEDALERARAVDVFLLGVSCRMRILRQDLGDPDELRDWLAWSIQTLIDGASATFLNRTDTS